MRTLLNQRQSSSFKIRMTKGEKEHVFKAHQKCLITHDYAVKIWLNLKGEFLRTIVLSGLFTYTWKLNKPQMKRSNEQYRRQCSQSARLEYPIAVWYVASFPTD